MEQNTLKQVKDVFKDYNTINKEIVEARIKSMNLFKKTNSLELVLLTDKEIKIRDISSFENYLESRFGIKLVTTKVEMTNKEEQNVEETCETSSITNHSARIEKEWIDIIDYISNKHPMTKAILNNSKISIDGNAANVILEFKGREFLLAKKYDEILSNLLKDIYGCKYKVSYIEQVSEEAIRRKQILAEEMQKQAIIEAQKESLIEIEESKANSSSATSDFDMQESAEIPYAPPIDDKDITVNDEEYLQELEDMEEEANVIFGTLSKAKEFKVKIKDIEASNKKITIEGRIVSCDARETKTGKGMLIYDIYDGTGIITCKSFTKNIEEGNEVADKIRKASGIKTTGKAGLDNFAGDVTLMANTIVEINGENFPKLPTEDEDSPLILGMNPNIKEPLVKIQDLNTDSGNVSIDGEVIRNGAKRVKIR